MTGVYVTVLADLYARRAAVETAIAALEKVQAVYRGRRRGRRPLALSIAARATNKEAHELGATE